MEQKILTDLCLQYKRCVELYNSRVLYSDSIFTESVFMEILSKLDDTLQALNNDNQRINFSDDMDTKKTKDITDLINKLRNASQHSRTSGESNIKYGRFQYCRLVGKIPPIFGTADEKIQSDFDDDIAFFYGYHRIYLNRHVRRLLVEINNKLQVYPNGIT